MKQLFPFIFLFFALNTINAQQTSIQFHPANPTTSDSIMVVMDFSFQFVNCYYGIVLNEDYIYDDRIDFYPEFCPGSSQDSLFCITSDTLYLEPLAFGFYDINVYVGLTGQCPVGNNYIGLDTISSALQVDFSNSILEAEKNNLKIFPNPTNSQFNIEIENGENYKLTLINSLGQQLFSQELTQITNTVSLDLFPKGIYFLEIESKKTKRRTVRKIEVL